MSEVAGWRRSLLTNKFVSFGQDVLCLAHVALQDLTLVLTDAPRLGFVPRVVTQGKGMEAEGGNAVLLAAGRQVVGGGDHSECS